MPVKDLVPLYELPSQSSSRGSGSRSTKTGYSADAATLTNPHDLPPPRPARFLKQRVSGAPSPLSSDATVQQDASSLPVNPFLGPSDSITERNLTRPSSFANSTGVGQSKDLWKEEQTALIPTYPPRKLSYAGNSSSPSSRGSNSQTQRSYESKPSHRPIPATVVFARDAHPLHLPKLDVYLSSLPAPRFEEPMGSVFPPMDKLENSGRTLDDFEHNSTVTPPWRDRKSILGTSVNALIGFLGSSALASFYSLQGLINTLQIFALILSTIVHAEGNTATDKWRQLFMGTIPNIIALNFASVLTQSLLFLLIFMGMASLLLYYFYRNTIQCDRYTSIEGLQQTEKPGSQWGLVIVTFLLTVIYLPLSTMAVHVLVWSEELWAIPNPYINATLFPPVLPPLGPPNEFRDPLDFCWTTSMKRNEVNYALIMVVLALITFFFVGIWFPVTLRRVIRQSVPRIDNFTDLGRPRTNAEMDREYHRLLNRDHNPFAFLYNGFRRGWATYISTYLFAKLSTLIIIAVINPDNCLFRSISRTGVPIVRQVLLVISTVGFFIAQCVFAPFLDPLNNASEWTSRLNYLTTSLTALAINLNIPGKEIVDSYVLYSIYILTYGLGFYFTVIGFGWMQKLVKKLTRRVDFSIDIFSPRLDIGPSSVHTKRRIWQESISTLLLTSPDCKIPDEQPMAYAQARDSEFPPYLLNFSGSPGERHVENIRILREVGSVTYKRAMGLLSGPDSARYRYLQDEIQRNYVGPDGYWRGPEDSGPPNCTSHFGNAWWIPFPPTLVIRYDEGPYSVLTTVADLEEYIKQNSSSEVHMKRQIRMSLRALEGQIVKWPYEHVYPVGSQSIWCCGRRRYNAVMTTLYDFAVIRIKRRGHLVWRGLSLGSGFEITLEYSKKVKVSADVIGLNEDFDLTPTLARFLNLNKGIIDEELYHIEERLSHYRRYHRKECRWKTRTLTYKFLTTVYDSPVLADRISQSCIEIEADDRVKKLINCSEEVFLSARRRLEIVSKSEASTWWYIFWDDLWRRNHETISGLQKHAADFNPHYVTSIAYTPLPRAILEAFLTQRGLLHTKPWVWDFFHAGFLNKLYLRLNDAVFRDSSKAVMFHLGNDKREFDMEDIDILTQGQSSTLGTGGGTDHDASGIIPRPTYRWEGLLNDPPGSGGRESQRKWFTKLGAWFGVTPLWRAGFLSNGISLDVKVENGRYVLLYEGSDTTSGTYKTWTTSSR